MFGLGVTPVSPRNSKSGRGDWIRTSDPLRPRQVRYQAALRPDSQRLSHAPAPTVYFSPPTAEASAIMRMRVGGSTLIAIALAAQSQALRAEWTTTTRPSRRSRAASGRRRRRLGWKAQRGFWAESTSTCRFDKATSKSTCTNEYVDSVGDKGDDRECDNVRVGGGCD